MRRAATNLIALIKEADGRWSAWIDALPGCAVSRYTKDEALQAMHDATLPSVRRCAGMGSMPEGSVLHPLAQPGFDLMDVPAPPRCPSHVKWKTSAASVALDQSRECWPGLSWGRSHHGLRPLALMGTIGALIEFVVHLPGIFAAETKIAPNLLQGRPMSYQAVKAFERIRTIFLLKLPFKFIRWLNVEFIAPVGHCRRAHVQ